MGVRFTPQMYIAHDATQRGITVDEIKEEEKR
jgi:hypothetical protein